MNTNVLYYGDNLDILRRDIPDESLDLVCLEPPFNSDRNYNVIFKDESGRKSDAQLLAFEDTWHWGPRAEATYAYLTETGRHHGRVPDTVSTIMAALRTGIGENQMMAYLVELAARQVASSVDVLLIDTSWRFTKGATSWVERDNQRRTAPRIEVWPESHLEMLLAQRPHLARL